MIKAAKYSGEVGKAGKIEINTPELPEGTKVEIIILVEDSESDTTEYLLSTDANLQELFAAIERVEKDENLVIISSEDWHEKYCL